jgi:hypothetical protein
MRVKRGYRDTAWDITLYDLHTIGGERYRRLYTAVLGP